MTTIRQIVSSAWRCLFALISVVSGPTATNSVSELVSSICALVWLEGGTVEYVVLSFLLLTLRSTSLLLVTAVYCLGLVLHSIGNLDIEWEEGLRRHGPYAYLSRIVVVGFLESVGVSVVDSATPDPFESKSSNLGNARQQSTKHEKPHKYTIRVYDPAFYARVAADPELAFGETYVEGWWDTNDLEGIMERCIRLQGTASGRQRQLVPFWRSWFNEQSETKSKRVAALHYDGQPDLFDAFLDSSKQYSCAYWPTGTVDISSAAPDSTLHSGVLPREQQADADTTPENGITDDDTAVDEQLERGQHNKMRLICEKLRLAPGMKVLDIGCGWSGLMRYMAENYGVHCVGVTLSKSQMENSVLGYLESGDYVTVGTGSVVVYLNDYRRFCAIESHCIDRVVSVGFFEHVGPSNYTSYFECVKKVLKPNGITLLHTIASNKTVSKTSSPWMDRYVFPGGHIPSVSQIATAWQANGFYLGDYQANMGPHYATTLRCWYQKAERYYLSLRVRDTDYERRLFRYYLLGCATAFRHGSLQVHQVVLTPKPYGTTTSGTQTLSTATHSQHFEALPMPRIS